MDEEDPWLIFGERASSFPESMFNFTFRMNGEPFSFFTQPPPRPKVEIVTISLNGRTMEVPLSNETVDALFDRAEEYKRLKESQRRAKAAEDEARRRQEARQERIRQEEAARKQDEAFRREREGSWQNGPYGYSPGGSRFRGSDDNFQSGSRPSPSASPMQKGSLVEQLAGFAEIELQAAKELDLKVLWRRAQRKCHPDTGGSHEKWLELHKLESYIS